MLHSLDYDASSIRNSHFTPRPLYSGHIVRFFLVTVDVGVARVHLVWPLFFGSETRRHHIESSNNVMAASHTSVVNGNGHVGHVGHQSVSCVSLTDWCLRRECLRREWRLVHDVHSKPTVMWADCVARSGVQTRLPPFPVCTRRRSDGLRCEVEYLIFTP